MRKSILLMVTAMAVGLSACQISDPVRGPSENECATRPAVDDDAIFLISVRMRECRDEQTSYGKLRASKVDYASYAAGEPSKLIRAREADWREALHRQVIAKQKPPVIFIHGYWNSAKDGNERTAELREIIGDWPIISVTWPSYAQPTKYFWDEANNEFSLLLLRREILQIAHHHPKTILIAHSMGNRILLDAVLHSGNAAELFDKLIMASPDVDRGMLGSRLSWPNGLGVQTTIYASRKDQALAASWRAHGAPRAGDLSTDVRGRFRAPVYRTLNNAQLVDTTATTSRKFGHRDFTSAPENRVDLCRVINGGNLDEIRDDYVTKDEDGNEVQWPNSFVLRKFAKTAPTCKPYRAPAQS